MQVQSFYFLPLNEKRVRLNRKLSMWHDNEIYGQNIKGLHDIKFNDNDKPAGFNINVFPYYA